MNLTRTIERRECPICGRSSTTPVKRHFYRGEICRNEMVMRTYVAVDALVADEAIRAAIASLIGQDVTDTIVYDEMRSVLSAAVDAVTGSERDA